MHCSAKDLQQLVTFAEQQVNNKIPFSTVAFVLAPMPLVPYAGSGTFCSKLCADILAAGNLLHLSQSQRDKLTPSALHRIIAPASKPRKGGKVIAIDFK